MKHHALILGAGITGITAGFVSNLPIYEATEMPGGICSSYYMRAEDSKRLNVPPNDCEAYRFELGGGHWIWGVDPIVLPFIRSITPFKTYTRKAAVFLPDKNILVPYPIQAHLRYLEPELAAKALEEMIEASKLNNRETNMAEWLESSFGPALCNLFFWPFHELYTAGLYRNIEPQDANKSPVNLKLAIQGAFNEVPLMGYNSMFIYPENGLNSLVQNMAKGCDIRYGMRAVEIDTKNKSVYFDDGSKVKYELLISTLPLNHIIDMSDLDVGYKPEDPYTSVLVINIGAIKGRRCPQDHWVYFPKSLAGFHRVGFYSNVDISFLPESARKTQDRVSVYVEKSYFGKKKPNDSEINILCNEVVKELQELEWIGDVEVLDPTWIDVGYTWSWSGSCWRGTALKTLETLDVYQVGRFARWNLLSGISDSIKDGLVVGAAFDKCE